jgi:uncharacterized membrane protein
VDRSPSEVGEAAAEAHSSPEPAEGIPEFAPGAPGLPDNPGPENELVELAPVNDSSLGAVDKGAQPPASTLLRWAQHIPLVVMMWLYAVHFGRITVALLRVFGQPAYDMAMPDQGVWLLSRFHDPFLTVAGRNLFGDHATFIYLLLVPVYWVYPHTAVLLVVQAALQAAGAIPVYLLARHLLKSTVMATGLAAAYLLNPVLQQTDFEQFHVEAFETPLLALAIYAAVVWRPRLLVVSVALVLCCKEDAALYTFPVALWVVFRRDRRLGSACIAASAAVAAFDNLFLIPTLLGYTSAHGGRLPFGGLGGLWRTAVRQPGQLWAYLVSNGRPWYVWQMVFSAGFVFLAAPEVAAIGVFQLGTNVVSSFGYQHEIPYHYSMPIVAVLVCGSVYAVSRLRSTLHRYVATSVVVLSALWSCVLWGAAPFSDFAAHAPLTDTPSLNATRHLLAKIPPTAVVSAVYEFVPALDHRTEIYMWPNPFYQSYYGNPKYDGTYWPFSSTVQYLVLPACLACDQGSSNSVAVFDKISSQFREVAATPSFALYKRVAPPPSRTPPLRSYPEPAQTSR